MITTVPHIWDICLMLSLVTKLSTFNIFQVITLSDFEIEC